MKFIELPLAGAYAIEVDRLADERGYFARTWCRREFAERSLVTRLEQCSVSHNARPGTLRGLHYQVAPFAETKLVSCVSGSIYDVIVDVRRDSPTYLRWYGERLDANSHRALYIPEGLAHGFQTLTDDSTVFYMISAEYHPPSARGLRWDDPALAIEWPLEPASISARDRAFPLLQS